MKQLIFLMLLVPFTGLAQVSIPEAGIQFELPNQEWYFADKYEFKHGPIYIYKRTPIVDSRNYNVISAIMVSVEKREIPGPEYLGLEVFSLQRVDKIGLDYANTITNQCDKIKLKNAAAYLGQYEDMGLQHHLYTVTKYIEGKYVTVNCDITSELFDQLDPEFTKMLGSIKLLHPEADTVYMKPWCE